MDKVKLPVHNHPLIPTSRFCFDRCKGCGTRGYLYGGYHCNEPGCDVMFHKECAESLPEINHPSHPEHLLKLDLSIKGMCPLCTWSSPEVLFYYCSLCDYKLDLRCTKIPLAAFEHSKAHEHPLKLSMGREHYSFLIPCPACKERCFAGTYTYGCSMCDVVFHMDCVKLFPEINHTSHPKHPLKYFKYGKSNSTNKDCVLCGKIFHQQFHHCDVCNFSICTLCAESSPPIEVLCVKTHEHQLYLVPRHVIFTCNACGTQGDRSPYLCLQCNFMIHRACIDLPRVININRHDHRMSYTCYLGSGNWTCGVCRQKVDGFYGAYACSKCSTYVVHSRCAIRYDVWDKIELEGTPEEDEELAPFEVIDENMIKHFSHDHNLKYNKEDIIIDENTQCEACVFQIGSNSFYACEQCDFILHETCANLSRKKRHVCHNQQFTLHVDSLHEVSTCDLCSKNFTGFRYKSGSYVLDVRCGSISEPFVHESHPHPLYYSMDTTKKCDACSRSWYKKHPFSCDECDFVLDFKCALLPKKIMKQRYDDHPLFLSYGDTNVDTEYWCDVCERRVNPKKWFYTCNICGITLHVSCVVGDFTYRKPGRIGLNQSSNSFIIPSNGICRPFCSMCKSRCYLPCIKRSRDGVDEYICSLRCL